MGLSRIALASAVPVVCAVNFGLLRVRYPRVKILAGTGLGALACAISYVLFVAVVVVFSFFLNGWL